jgi:hypothetical protein
VGGSGYFDGSGDYLSFTTSSSFALTGDFTIECWAYFTSSASSQPIFEQYLSAGFLLQVSPGSSIGGTLYINSTAGADGISLSGASCPINAWNFLRIVRSGSTVTVYCNGVSAGSRTRTGNVLVNSTAFGIANYSTTYFTGYLSGVRIVASALTGTEVPTSPSTAITNTSLLLNFTNAGVVDATAKNVLETVGNAQISNGAGGGKWGGGSISFDGTGDWLIAPSNNLASFETGDFSVEMWVYPTSVGGGTERFIFDTRATGTDAGLAIYLSTTGVLSITSSNAVRATAGTVSANTWSHIAVTRASGTLTAYVNGTAGTPASYTSSITCPGRIRVGVKTDDSTPYVGYIDDLRITKGYARTMTTVPTAPFPVQ